MGFSKKLQCHLLLAIAVTFGLLFYLMDWDTKPSTNFRSRLKIPQRRVQNIRRIIDANHFVNAFSSMRHSPEYDHTSPSKLQSLNRPSSANGTESDQQFVTENNFINVAMSFVNAEKNKLLENKLSVCIGSMFSFTSVPIRLHVIGNSASLDIAEKIINKECEKHDVELELVLQEMDPLIKKLHPFIDQIKSFFTYKEGAYYSGPLFFLSLFMHDLFPHLDNIILIDIDVKFNIADIFELFQHFTNFAPYNLIGVAYEQQPVYRHIFTAYRRTNKSGSELVGLPPPEGFPGFNSGVLLLYLKRIRTSALYKSMLDPGFIESVVEKYKFQGHLGDQDLLTLLFLERRELFYVLPCEWNRQLCFWWRNHGYGDVFDEYHKCQRSSIKLYHANCNSAIPVKGLI